MDIKSFLELPIEDLALITGKDKTRWSKYFNGQPINENTLNEVANSLNMEPHIALQAINKRRKQNAKEVIA